MAPQGTYNEGTDASERGGGHSATELTKKREAAAGRNTSASTSSIPSSDSNLQRFCEASVFGMIAWARTTTSTTYYYLLLTTTTTTTTAYYYY